jgi:23S rRNA pseudouridine2605 synthase
MRLAKYIAHAGVASRRASEVLIATGRVRVDGEVVTDPARDVGQHSRVLLDGRPLAGPEPRVVYALNKPLGVVSTARDPHTRPTVLDLVPVRGPRLYPVGRLDSDTTGLILLTNDGALANRLTHPRHRVPRTYHARVGGGPVGEAALSALRHGVQLDDGPTAPAHARRLRAGRGPAGQARREDGLELQKGSRTPRGAEWIELTIREGRNRQVRRMCQAVGHPVLALERVALGPLRLTGLAPGAYRRLDAAEVERLRAAGAPVAIERRRG